MGQQSGHAFLQVGIEPAIDGIGIAPPQQARGRDPVGRLALCHFQDGGTAFSHVGFAMMIAGLFQLLALLLRERHGPSMGGFWEHSERLILVVLEISFILSLPYSIVKVHQGHDERYAQCAWRNESVVEKTVHQSYLKRKTSY